MKKQKFLNTLVALVILAGTWGAFTLYDKHKSHEKPAVATSNATKIFSVDAQHIQSIAFKPHDGEAFTCRREDGKWAITNPQHLQVDQGNFSGVLNSLTTATIDEVVDPHPTDLKQFGLDPPSFILDVSTDAKPQSFTLLLGDDTPASGGTYAQVSGNPQVFTLASYVKSSLEKKLFDLRDRRALTLDAEQLRKIGVQYKGTSWTLEKNPEGIWDMVLPPSVRADRFTVDGLVSQLRGLTMQTIAEEDKKKPGDYGLGSPELRLELTGNDGTQTIVVGKKEKDAERYYATNSALQPVFTLNSEFVTQFKKDQAELREKDLFSFSSFEANHIEIDTPKGDWVFNQQAGKWKETAPKTKDVSSDKMETLLTQIRDLRADSFPKAGSLADFGLANPPYKFSVRSGQKNATETVEAAKSGGHIYGRRSTDPMPSELSNSALDDIEKTLGQL
jgi:hypothetical protein